jgi:predicted  nucleic acid-binding Zn-ribbon protein
MAFLDNLSKKIGDVAEAATDKAKELAELTKLSSSVSSEQKQIESLYTEIGKIMFEKEKENPESVIASQCRDIIDSQKTIDELNAKINAIKSGGQPSAGAAAGPGRKFCPNCGAEISGGKFCQSCGTPV